MTNIAICRVGCQYLKSSIAVHQVVNSWGKYEFFHSSTNGLVGVYDERVNGKSYHNLLHHWQDS